MRVEDLNKDQLHELKENYLTQLDDSGELEEVLGIKSLSYDVLARADEYMSDEFILEHYAGVEFSGDDFTTSESEGELSKIEISIVKVDADDYGDKTWQYKMICRDAEGYEIWSDYYEIKPRWNTVLKNIANALDEGVIKIGETTANVSDATITVKAVGCLKEFLDYVDATNAMQPYYNLLGSDYKVSEDGENNDWRCSFC